MGKREKAEDDDEEVKAVGSSTVKGRAPAVEEERKSGRGEVVEDDSEDEVVMEDETDRTQTVRYPPISLPLRGDDASSSPPPLSAAAVVTDSASGHLLFFQLPSHLPLQPSLFPSPPAASSSLPPRPPGAPSPPRPFSDVLPDTKDPSLLLASASSSSSALSFQSKTALQKRLLTFHPSFENSLRWVKPGEVGRLLVMRSGRVKLEVGGVRMDVDRGMECDFHQQVVSIHAEGAAPAAAAGATGPMASAPAAAEEGKQPQLPQTAATVEARKDWIELGEVRQRLVCTLDVDDLLRLKEGGSRQAGEKMDVDDMDIAAQRGHQQSVRVKKEKE